MARSNNATAANYLATASSPVTAFPLTLACWFYPNDATNYYALMDCHNFAKVLDNDYVAIGANGSASGDPVFIEAARNGTYQGHNSSTGYTANTWNHACGVFTATNNRTVYCNGGGAVTATTTANTVASRFDRVNLASFVDSSGTYSPLNGRVAEAAIWNVSLTAAEVASLATGISPLRIRPSALVAYWPIWGNDSPEMDLKGGLPLSINGTMSKADHPRVYYPTGMVLGFPSSGGGGGATIPIFRHHYQMQGVS